MNYNQEELNLTELKKVIKSGACCNVILDEVNKLEAVIIKNKLRKDYNYDVNYIINDSTFKETKQFISVSYHASQLTPMVIEYGYYKVNKAICELYEEENKNNDEF